MSNIGDTIYDDGLYEIKYNGDTLYLLDADIGLDSSLLEAHKILMSDTFLYVGLSDYPGGGRQYTIGAADYPDTITTGGTITHFALCDGMKNILASGALTTPITVYAGDKLYTPTFSVVFKDTT
jgi:hypothetical protein